MKSSFKFLDGRSSRLYAPYIPLQITPPPNNINLRYDKMVVRHVSNCIRSMIWWRGYETWIDETDGYARLKIVSGINIGEMFQIFYIITRNNITDTFNVVVPYEELQRG